MLRKLDHIPALNAWLGFVSQRQLMVAGPCTVGYGIDKSVEDRVFQTFLLALCGNGKCVIRGRVCYFP